MKNWKKTHLFSIILGAFFLLIAINDIRILIFAFGDVAIVTGKLNIIENPRDPDLGITANSIFLKRAVQQYTAHGRKNHKPQMLIKTYEGLDYKNFYAKTSIGDDGIFLDDRAIDEINSIFNANYVKNMQQIHDLPSDPQIEKKYALYSKGDYYTNQKDHDVIMRGDYSIEFYVPNPMNYKENFTVVGKIENNVIGKNGMLIAHVGEKTLSEVKGIFISDNIADAMFYSFLGLPIILIALRRHRKNAESTQRSNSA